MHEDVLVQPDSEVIRALYSQPLSSDFFALRVARAKFHLAGEAKAEQALDAYLARTALLALNGEAIVPQGTIGKIVTDFASQPSVPDGLVARTLATSLNPRLATDATYIARSQWDHVRTEELPGVWSSRNQGPTGRIVVLVYIENSGRNPIAQFDTRLRVEGSSTAAPLDLNCQSLTSFEQLDPRQKALHVCTQEGADIVINDAVRAVTAASKDPSRWHLLTSRINFIDPPVSLNANGIHWLEARGGATDRARVELLAMDCKMRGVCADEARQTLETNPQYIMYPVAALLGAVVGWGIARRRRRPLLTGILISLLSFGGIQALFWLGILWARFVPILWVTYGTQTLGFFYLSLWLVLLVGYWRNTRSATTLPG